MANYNQNQDQDQNNPNRQQGGQAGQDHAIPPHRHELVAAPRHALNTVRGSSPRCPSDPVRAGQDRPAPFSHRHELVTAPSYTHKAGRD